MSRSLLVCAMLLGAGCASFPLVLVDPPRASDQATFERLSKLAGTWQAQDPASGAWYDAATFKVSSNQNAVVETMFPGQPHEMTNVYHFDGPSVVMTHYCAGGNQPRMRATATGGATVAFEFDSVTNVSSAETDVMSSMTLQFVDDDHIVESWSSLRQVAHAEPMVFKLQRKR